jgi:hypothetical protein
MSYTSPYVTPRRHVQLKSNEQPLDDTIDDMLGVIRVPDDVKQAVLSMAKSIDEFVVYDKQDCQKFVDDLVKANKTNTFLLDQGNRRFLTSQLHMCVQYRAHGGSFKGDPTLQEMASFVKIAMSPALMNAATPAAGQIVVSKEPAPIDSSKFSDAIAVWNGDLESWFEWKKKLLTKCRQHPEFEKVLLDEAESKKDTRRSDILYGILLEKTEGGQAHTLVESLPIDKQSGYEAYQVILKHMEGSEMRKRLELQSKKQLKKARLNPGTSLLEFQGDINKYFQLVDDVHRLQSIDLLPVERRIKIILGQVKNPEYNTRVELIERELKAGKAMTIEQVFADLLQVETRLKEQEDDDDDVPAHGVPTMRRVEHNSNPGSVPTTTKGGSGKMNFHNFQLPTELYNGFSMEQKVFWHKFINAARENNGDTAKLKTMSKPSDADVQAFKKRAADRKEIFKARKKARKAKAAAASPNASGTVAPYLCDSHDANNLSIQALSTGTISVPTREKTMPKLRILMFKDPDDGLLPISSIPLAQRPIGKLAICAQRSSNPKEEAIDAHLRDYSYVAPPLTRISNTQTRQVQIARLMKLRKQSAQPHGSSNTDAGIRNQLDIIGIARENERKQVRRSVSGSVPTVSTSTMIVRATSPGKIRTKTILDTGCDWSVVAQGWHVTHDYEEVFHCQGAFFTDQAEFCF